MTQESSVWEPDLPGGLFSVQKIAAQVAATTSYEVVKVYFTVRVLGWTFQLRKLSMTSGKPIVFTLSKDETAA